MGAILSKLSLGDWLNLTGILITFIQITRTGRIVRKTRTAIENASLQSSVYNVLVIAPRISSIENQLEYAARHNDVEAFATLLRDYKDLAAELDGLLHQESKHSTDARVVLQKSLTQVTAAKLPPGGTRITDLYERTRNVRKAISAASAATITLTARLRSDLEPPNSVRRVPSVRSLVIYLQEKAGKND